MLAVVAGDERQENVAEAQLLLVVLEQLHLGQLLEPLVLSDVATTRSWEESGIGEHQTSLVWCDQIDGESRANVRARMQAARSHLAGAGSSRDAQVVLAGVVAPGAVRAAVLVEVVEVLERALDVAERHRVDSPSAHVRRRLGAANDGLAPVHERVHSEDMDLW